MTTFQFHFPLTHVIPVGLSIVVPIQLVSPDLEIVVAVSRVCEHLRGGPLEDHFVPQGHCVPEMINMDPGEDKVDTLNRK